MAAIVETSSAADLSVGTGSVNTRALKGLIGSWLLDPTNVVVANSGGTVTPATIDASTTNVTLQATGGDVTFTDAVSMSNNGVGLTAEAGNSIFVNAPITTRGGGITLSANDPNSSPTGDGQIQLNAALNTAGNNQTGGNVLLTLNGASSAIDLGANITTAGGSVTVFDPIVLDGNVAIATNAGGSAGGAISFYNSIDNPPGSPGTASLTLNSGTAETDIESDIGDNSALSAFTVSGAGQFILDGDDIRTTSGGVSLTANAISYDCCIRTTGGPVTFNGPVTLTGVIGGAGQYDPADIDTTAGGAASGASVTFNGTVDALGDGSEELAILAGNGNIAFNGAVGGIHPLSGLYASGGSIALNAPITTAGPQTYIDPSGGGITLAGNLTDTTATDISLVGSVNVTTPNLTIATAGNVSAGNVVITGSVGGDNNSLTVNAGGAAGGLVWNDGTLTCPTNSCIEGPTQTLSGTVDTATLDQTKHIILSGDTTVTNTSGTLTVTPSIDLAPGAAPATLTVTQQAGSTGGIGLAGSIGDGNALGTIAINGATGGGSIVLGGTAIQTGNAPISLNGPTIVANNLTIDTAVNSASGVPGTGATIAFNGTLDNSAALAHTLTLAAGSAGNIDFNARVGSGLLADDGTPLSLLLIESANAVNIDIPTGPNVDGLNAGTFGINANYISPMVTPSTATVNAPTSFISTVQSNGGSGEVYIGASGNVEVGLGIYTFGSAGNSGGNVTINSTQGSVAIEDAPTSLAQIPQSILGSGATAIPNTDALGIAAFGGNAESSGQSPGWGGNVTITAAGNIILPYGVTTAGGNAVFGGSTVNGGNAGSLTLTAGGNVYAGAFPATGYSVSGAVNGNVVGIVTAGGFAGDTSNPSDSGAGGNGGNVTITGNQLFLTHVYAEGGSTLASALSDPTTTSAGGNITLIGTAASGAAVTLYGQSVPLGPGTGPDLLAVAGATGATFADYAGGVPQFNYPITAIPHRIQRRHHDWRHGRRHPRWFELCPARQ